MHEAQTKEATAETTQPAKAVRRQQPRPYKFYVVVTHLQKQVDTAPSIVLSREVLEFPDKTSLREELSHPRFDGADIRIIRGYEMKAQTKRHISIN